MYPIITLLRYQYRNTVDLGVNSDERVATTDTIKSIPE